MSPVEPHRATITVEWSPDTSEHDSAAIEATLNVACDELVEALHHDAVSITLVSHRDRPGREHQTPAFDNAVEVLANGLRRRRHTAYSDEGLAAYLLESLTLGPDPLATLADPKGPSHD